MKYSDLINTCIDCILEFDPIKMTVDSHSEQFIKKHKRNLEDTEAVFVKQVFYGTFRYEEFLKVLSGCIFRHLPSQTNRNDWPLYHIFGYLTCFRFEELPFYEFKKMVQSQDAVKMNVFFTFLFDIDLLIEVVKPGWIDIYDEGYIDNDIIGKLEDRLPNVAELLAQLSEKATGKKSELVNTLESTLEIKKTDTKQKTQKRASTIPQPFQLTKPKPKQLPEPIKIPKQIEIKPVPKNLNKNTLATIKQDREQKQAEAKQKVQSQYNEKQPFKFQTHQRPTNIDKIQDEVEKEFTKKHSYVKTYYRPAPDFSEPSDVKLNAAAILREEMKIVEKEKEEEKRLNDLEWNMRDSTEFENWKLEMKHQDKMQELEDQQRKKIEMALAREAAMIAYDQKIEENKKQVQEMKKISEEKGKELVELKKEDLQKKQKLIEGVLETRNNANIEKEKMLQKNKQIHDQKIEETEKLIALKKAEEEEERKKRDELIRQIRELERQPRKRVCGYDPTETMGYGLLEEMSMVELRERLEVVRMEQKQKEEEVRQTNLEKKDQYLNSLQKKVAKIKQNREQLSKQKQQEREERKLKEKLEKQRLREIKEKQILEMQQKIKSKKQQKKNEEDQLAKDLREIKLKRQYMNASAALVEEMAWKAQQQGQERELQHNQVEKLIEQEGFESIKYKERKILANTAQRTVQNKLEFNQQYDENLERGQKENEILYRQLREDQKLIVNSIKEYEKKHAQNMVERETFKYKISEMSLTNAKTSQQKKKQLELSKKNQQKQRKSQPQQQDLELPGQKYGTLPQVEEEEQQQQIEHVQA